MTKVEFDGTGYVFVFRDYHRTTVIAKRGKYGWLADAWRGGLKACSDHHDHRTALSALKDAHQAMDRKDGKLW